MTTHSILNSVHDRYGPFTLIKITPIRELNAVLREIVHEPSGAHIMHIECDDPENLFCLSFRTLPYSSNGVAHILEHTVLCGSKRFPVKDPFFSMNRRSLNTFMNALTGSDFTCYPAASMVEKDFYNLLEVYLDAVFHPLLKKESFLQEGHRLEFAQPDNPKSPLEIKGIVYNEMKGSMASADSRLWHEMCKALCPDLPYAFNSGGEPKHIPDLTYEQLIDFHDEFYDPSRCLFFFYGNFPLKKHLDFILEKTLKNVQSLPPQLPIPHQPRFSAPVTKEVAYPAQDKEELENKVIVSFGWLTAPLQDQEVVLALSVLDSVLMDTDASPLKYKLLQTGLCAQADAFMDTEMSEVPYVIICKGCEKDNVDSLEKALREALKEIASKPIPPHFIESAIHQLEFSRTEITGDHAPFGLTLFMRSALAKQHDCPPENALIMHALFEDLLKKVKDPLYLPSLLRKYLIANPHCVRLVMIPDPELQDKEAMQEKQYLDAVRKRLSEIDIQTIIEDSKKLAVYQNETARQDLSCLPKIAFEDLPTKARNFSLVHEQGGNLEIFHHDCFTNHIVYADLVFDLPQLSEEDLTYAQIFAILLAELGAGPRNYTQQLDYIQASTGGISSSLGLNIRVDDHSSCRPSLTIRGKALVRKVPQLMEIMGDIASSPHFNDSKRIEELIKQLGSSLHSNLNRNALKYAVQLSLSGMSAPSHINNLWHGLPFYKTIQRISQDLPGQIPMLVDRLLVLKDILLCSKPAHLVLSCDEKAYQTMKNQNFYSLSHLPSRATPLWKTAPRPSPVFSQARVIASPVAFNAEALPTLGYLHPYSAALSTASQLMENKVLHEKIREQGGAYGSGATYNLNTGHFYFHSYRDPHIARSLENFNYAIEYISQGKFDHKDLEEAKLGIIQGLEMPVPPSSRAMTAYGWWRSGKTLEIRQHFRDRLLALTAHDIQHAVDKGLVNHKKESVFVTFAGKELLEKEKSALEQIRGSEVPILSI